MRRHGPPLLARVVPSMSLALQVAHPPRQEPTTGTRSSSPLKNSITANSRLDHPHPGPASRVATAGEAPAATFSTAC